MRKNMLGLLDFSSMDIPILLIGGIRVKDLVRLQISLCGACSTVYRDPGNVDVFAGDLVVLKIRGSLDRS